MKTKTAEIVAFIANNVRIIWPTIAKQDRLYVISKTLVEYKDKRKFANFISLSKSEINITTPERDESIILTVDGDLGVYYIKEDDEREPIRISLLKTRTVQVTKVFNIEVPCTGSESLEELFSLSNDYDSKLINITQEELKNETE